MHPVITLIGNDVCAVSPFSSISSTCGTYTHLKMSDDDHFRCLVRLEGKILRIQHLQYLRGVSSFPYSPHDGCCCHATAAGLSTSRLASAQHNSCKGPHLLALV